MYSAYSKDPVVNGGLGVRKRFKGLVSRRPRRERQKTAYRRQKSGGRRQGKSEDRSQKSEVRRQEAGKVRRQKSEVRSQKAEDRGFGRLAKHLPIYTSKHLKQYMPLQCRNIEI